MISQSRLEVLGHLLPITRHIQSDRKWCYAACATMVLHYYGQTSVGQSDIAAYVQQLKGLPGSTDFRNNRSGVDAEDIERIYSSWGIRSTLLSGLVSFDTIKKEINAGRPVQLSIKWISHEDSSHVVIVFGWQESNGEKFLMVHDPLLDDEYEGAIRYGWLQLGCGLGAWEHTWVGMRPHGFRSGSDTRRTDGRDSS